MKIRMKANRNIMDLPDKRAERFVRAGIAERIEEPPNPEPNPMPELEESAVEPEPSPDPFEGLGYNELQVLAAELPEDQKPSGRKKTDLIAALRRSGYGRRDLRAEE